MSRNRDHGVSIVNSPNNTLRGNTIAQNGLHGVTSSAAGPSATPSSQNIITDNGLDGLNVAEASGNRITGNTIERNGNDGVELFGRGTRSSVVAGNDIVGNALDGVRVVAAPGNWIGGRQRHLGQRGRRRRGHRGLATGRSSRGTSSAPMSTAGRRWAIVVGVLLNETSGVFVGGESGVLGTLPSGKDAVLSTGANIIAGNRRTGVQISGTSSNGNTIRNNLIGLALDVGDGDSATNFLGNGIRANPTPVAAATRSASGSSTLTRTGSSATSCPATGSRASTSRDATSTRPNEIVGNWIGTDARGRTPYEIAFPGGGSRLIADFQADREPGDGGAAQRHGQQHREIQPDRRQRRRGAGRRRHVDDESIGEGSRYYQ